MSTTPPYRALQITLGALALLGALGGLLMILGSRPLILFLFMYPPEAEVSTLLLFTLKELGGFALMLSLLLGFAFRDPARNVAIIDAVIAGLCILAVTPLLSLLTLDLTQFYPAALIWGRSLVRLALAALLYYLRPEQETADPRQDQTARRLPADGRG